ncbi:hypothetical protein RRG08_031341 [Elysia crispata]|uniref:Uncharacterized protein n=1 Tax=Elysia crispata TaxID=231223 RepID=A0AAE0YIG7_9GAST|nr:hypothetical protein RRG08_031341 [Elysia crispata]
MSPPRPGGPETGEAATAVKAELKQLAAVAITTPLKHTALDKLQSRALAYGACNQQFQEEKDLVVSTHGHLSGRGTVYVRSSSGAGCGGYSSAGSPAHLMIRTRNSGMERIKFTPLVKITFVKISHVNSETGPAP